MTPETTLIVLALLVAAVLWLRHQWHLHRYPDVGCRACGGLGIITDTDWRDRVVSGPCPTCGGDS